MDINIDSREKSKAIKKILAEFDKQEVNYFVSKMFVGDYQSLDNPRLVVDRKQNLTELCSNVCQQHERFRNEIIRANKHGIKLIFLCEHGYGIETLEDVIWWKNPRSEQRYFDDNQKVWKIRETNAMKGEVLYNILNTMKRKYGCEFLFCDKKDTGKRIIKILGGAYDK